MLDMWDESDYPDEAESDDDFLRYHASMTHEELEACGQPTRPLEFPTPAVYEGKLVDLMASDHRTGVEYALKNILRRVGDTDIAYLIKKKLAKSSYGWVRLGVVLRRLPSDGSTSADQWQSTGDYVAIKSSSWAKIQSMRGRHLVDPIKEISVLQLIGSNDSSKNHVLGCTEVLQTDDFLYTIMPYCRGGDLCGKLDITGIQQFPDEDQARKYFRQILKSLVFLHRKGICHRNICLENFHLDSDDNLVLLDSGLSLRVPYCDPSNIGGVTDVSEGSCRLLMLPQGQCGQLMYLSPELLEQKPFDGHATDLWAAGITLFIMLVGVAPFGMAQCSDKRFQKISHEGRLKEFLSSLDVTLSVEAVDLLQNLLWRDPRDRLTLADVMAHPWVLGERFADVQIPLKIIDNQRCVQSFPHQEEEPTPQPQSAPESPVSIAQVSQGKNHRRKLSGGTGSSIIGKLRLVIPKKYIGLTPSVEGRDCSRQGE